MGSTHTMILTGAFSDIHEFTVTTSKLRDGAAGRLSSLAGSMPSEGRKILDWHLKI